MLMIPKNGIGVEDTGKLGDGKEKVIALALLARAIWKMFKKNQTHNVTLSAASRALWRAPRVPRR